MKLPELKKMNEQINDADSRRMINKLIDIIQELNKEIETLKKQKKEVVYINESRNSMPY